MFSQIKQLLSYKIGVLIQIQSILSRELPVV